MSVTNKVRTVTIEGAPWFVAADVCRVLGIGDPSQALRTFGEDEKGIKTFETPGGSQRMSALREPDLYRLIMRSYKPVASPFQDWVTREVLPAIRKTGTFKLEPGEVMPLPASMADAAQAAKAEAEL